jgi:hypothetical protein
MALESKYYQKCWDYEDKAQTQPVHIVTFTASWAFLSAGDIDYCEPTRSTRLISPRLCGLKGPKGKLVRRKRATQVRNIHYLPIPGTTPL